MEVEKSSIELSLNDAWAFTCCKTGAYNATTSSPTIIIMTRVLETNDLKGLATFIKSGECKKVALMVRSNW